MNFYVADTHGLYWYLIASPLLGLNAKKAFDEGKNGNAIIYIPSIVIAELYFLNKKYGEPMDFAVELARLENSPQFQFVSFAAADVRDFTVDAAVPEMHDRIIVGVARRLSAACLTRDAKIIDSQIVKIVW